MAKIEVTEKLLEQLKTAQLEHTARYIADALAHGYSDDEYDYLKGALALAQVMLTIDYNKDLNRLDCLLNKKSGALEYKGINFQESLDDFACDGIAEAFYKLKPNALKY